MIFFFLIKIIYLFIYFLYNSYSKNLGFSKKGLRWIWVLTFKFAKV